MLHQQSGLLRKIEHPCQIVPQQVPLQATPHRPPIEYQLDEGPWQKTDLFGAGKGIGTVKLGEGPTVSLGRENHPVLTDRLRKVAKRKKIGVQIETFSLTGGTDAYAIWTQHGGIPSAIISVPNRYMHSTVEMLDLRDLQNTAVLLAAFCADVKKGERFEVKV